VRIAVRSLRVFVSPLDSKGNYSAASNNTKLNFISIHLIVFVFTYYLLIYF